MLFQRLELTTALRPELVEGESILFVQDSVGLYEGKNKIAWQQNGSLYLTTHRICYVDKNDSRRCSAAISLRHIERWEHTTRFLKSSPKVILYPKALQLAEVHTSNGSKTQLVSESVDVVKSTSSWICPICSFPNDIPDGFDSTQATINTSLRPCKACGIQPPLTLILKSYISDQRQWAKADRGHNDHVLHKEEHSAVPEPFLPHRVNQCPRCTFVNHPSLSICEICGTKLPNNRSQLHLQLNATDSGGRDSNLSSPRLLNPSEFCMIAFRTDGDKNFVEKLSVALAQRRWILANAPSINEARQVSGQSGAARFSDANDLVQTRAAGLAGLEHINSQRRKANETVIGTALTDFETLVASSEQIKALANTFAMQNGHGSGQDVLHESALALNMALSKGSSSSNALYLSELSRTLAEYLTDDRQGVLKHQGGIMSLVDLFATYNRALNGVTVAIPEDFAQAAQLWEPQRMSVRLRQFKSGMLAVQRSDWSDDKIIAELLSWIQELKKTGATNAEWDWQAFGNGVTAQEAATRFGWSLGVANEELDIAEERGILCRETCAQGVRYWDNEFFNGS